MHGFTLILLMLGFGAIGWMVARARAARCAKPATAADRPNSLPSQHGWHMATALSNGCIQ